MLSYRHAFHAGNHADILKHISLCILLEHFKQKEKPFTYIDTHSGAGVYHLDSEWSIKTNEAKHGIEAVLAQLESKSLTASIPDVLQPYIELCKAEYIGLRYPGSPEIAYQLSRPIDSLVLSELHPADFELLETYMHNEKRVHLHKRNGFEMLKALPVPARTLVLIDPSYEVDSDYKDVISAVSLFYKRCSTGTIAVWYPIVPRRSSETQELKDRLSFLPSLQEKFICIEMFQKNRNTSNDEIDDFGMVGSGVIIINPPWQFNEKIESSLSWVAPVLQMDYILEFEG